MGEPIDLDLVELRCRLRGWPVLPGEDEVCCETPRGDVWVRADGTAYSIIPGADRTDPNCPLVALLTAPRWTLDRLLSEPPEGWMVVSDASDYPKEKLLEWGGSPHAPEMSMRILTKPKIDMDMVRWTRPCTLAQLAQRHEACAELARILAEVEP